MNNRHFTRENSINPLAFSAYFPRECVLFALQDMGAQASFLVYVLLLDVTLSPEASSPFIRISQPNIARVLNVSVKTVQRAMRVLKHKGYLNIIPMPPAKGGYQANQIEVLLPPSFNAHPSLGLV